MTKKITLPIDMTVTLEYMDEIIDEYNPPLLIYMTPLQISQYKMACNPEGKEKRMGVCYYKGIPIYAHGRTTKSIK